MKGGQYMADLYEELKAPPPGGAKETAFESIMRELEEEREQMVELGPEVIERLLIALRLLEKEATLHRLIGVMQARGFQYDDTDPDHPVLKRF